MDTHKKRFVAWVVIAGLFLGSAGTVFASNDSLPGDTLYGVKRATERVERVLAISDEAKAEVEFEHAELRLAEMEQLRTRAAEAAAEAERLALEERTRAFSDDAAGEVERAIQVLSQVRVRLEDRGNTTAVQAIEDNINRLADDSRQARFEIRVENQGDDQLVRVRFMDDDSAGDDRGRGRGSDDATGGSSNPSSSASGVPDVRESLDEVFCRGEWRDPEDCRGAPIETPPPGSEVVGGAGVGQTGDVRENANEVFCRGEWRDPEDCRGAPITTPPVGSGVIPPSGGASGGQAPDVRESANEVFCRGEWRDPVDCRGEPITTPPSDAAGATSPAQVPGVSVPVTGDVQEDPNEIFCDGEWRDPEDCAWR
jgi:hypothetical protein